eukprot:CAMPEP_0182469210 /NCGR_PEP_ID=MMETSP1319-20130603/16700_1 /TAXON_ID=172717 /ORGANISM="Bolidomonas pacifica, Strain RCC208" /LENGTH=88 /DNA_ID=CAMNT_0024669491 /DNA_START=176 /DNA_END=442 /DNA_ORIENTATION=-
MSSTGGGHVPPSSSGSNFVNHGLNKWESARRRFLESGPPSRSRVSRAVDVEIVIDKIYGNSSSEAFEPCSLPMMTLILNDLWAAEGLE